MARFRVGGRVAQVGRVAGFPIGSVVLDFREGGEPARILHTLDAHDLRALLSREFPFEDWSRVRPGAGELRARLILRGYGVAAEMTRVLPSVVRTEVPEEEEVTPAEPAEAPFVAAEVAVGHDPQEVEVGVEAETEPTALEVETEGEAPEVEVEIEAEGEWEPHGLDISVGGEIGEEELQA